MSKDHKGMRENKRCRVEELDPGVDWKRSFRLARLKMLSPLGNKSAPAPANRKSSKLTPAKQECSLKSV